VNAEALKGKSAVIDFAYFPRLWYALLKTEERSVSVTQVTQKGQILVPKYLRRKLGLKPGAKVHLAEEEGRLVLTPVPPDPIEAATGFLKGKFSLTQDLRREHREEARRERKNVLDSFALVSLYHRIRLAGRSARPLRPREG
jgi:AbrB family looped-hinge helix DNA binding protein